MATPPDGYIWVARASVFGLPVVGYDRLSSGTAQMRWRLLNVLPVVTADGPDLTPQRRRATGERVRPGADHVPSGDLAAGRSAGHRSGDLADRC